MDKDTLDKFKNMSTQELEQHQIVFRFFELLGVTEEDLLNLVALAKNYPTLLRNNKLIVSRQDELEKRLTRGTKEDGIPLTPLEDFNTEGQRLIPYVK